MDIEQAKNTVTEFAEQAEELIKDPSKIEELLQQLESKLKEVPTVGTALAKVPLVVSLVRSYITKEYTEISPKVVASLVGSFIYLVKGKDLIPDKTPLIGFADDIAVFAGALALCGPELDAYEQWRGQKDPDPEEAAE